MLTSSLFFANIPGVYAVMWPVNAEAATVSGEASQSCRIFGWYFGGYFHQRLFEFIQACTSHGTDRDYG